MKKRHPHKTNILLVNITRLGDMLQATPTISGMKMENPDAKITVLVEKQFEDICHILPDIDEILSIDLGMTVRSLAREQEGVIDAYEYVTETVEDLKRRNFDYCLNMSSSAYTALLLNLIGIKKNGGWTSDEEGFRVIESDWAQLFASSVFHQNRQYNGLNLVDVFRCSADVEKHPKKLMIDVDSKDLEYAENLIREAKFTNTGPIITVQAGASQLKRQWSPARFIKFLNILVNDYNARVVLTGTKKELNIINPIVEGCKSPNIVVAAGRTTVPQLSALLKLSKVLVTGDTGPMHVSVAVGTPVVSMFLASAFGFETGPYSEGNIVLQPVIGCGPCNPNKGCSTLECHDNISPELLAKITMMRVESDFKRLPEGLIDPNKLLAYRSTFDKFGFCTLEPLCDAKFDPYKKYRDAYRKMWLDDLADLKVSEEISVQPVSRLNVLNSDIEGIAHVVKAADEGGKLIKDLVRLIKDTSAPGKMLSEVSENLTEIDREIEQLGFHFNYLGPVTRMFIFAKENIAGSDALDLASQMERVYQDLKRRTAKLGQYYNEVL